MMAGSRSALRRRVKISATVDPQLIAAVDTYVAAHAGLDRSTVIDEALALWYARQQEAAMEAQYAGATDEGPPAEEWAAWRAMQRAAVERLLDRRDEE